MKKKQLTFVSFKKNIDGYRAFLDITDFLSKEKNQEEKLKQASLIYNNSISQMKTTLKEICACRDNRRPLPARIIWEFGDHVFRLTNNLANLAFQIDGLYEHLEIELNTKRKWLEKTVIFRRYIQKKESIPVLLNWGKCEKGTRRIAQQIQKGIFVT
jgi:hypothetical protein